MGDGDGDRFDGYVEALQKALGHVDREEPFRWYTTGLLLPLARKSVEPIAARVDPARVSAVHQSLHHFVAQADWSHAGLLAGVRAEVLPRIVATGPIAAWIVDDTGFPKKGRHSVGVTRQYCGQLGKQDNCQVAVSLSVANQAASLPIAWQLYLPQDWAEDPVRRIKAGVPADLTFKTKPMIALDQIAAALAAGVAPGVVLADAGYGADMKFQAGLLELELAYVVGVQPLAKVWVDGHEPLPAKPWSGRGRPPTNLRRTPDHQPVVAKAWATARPPEGWQDVTWREGVKGELGGRFAAARVRPAHRDYWRDTPWPELWLLVEWPGSAPEPTKYWFANLPADTPLERLVELAKLRWRIERDYLELKQELGLGHYEGRGWRGFHHHAALCIAAYGFLVGERLATSPSTTDSGSNRSRREFPPLPPGFAPRGRLRQARAPRPLLDRHPARPHRHPPRQAPTTMSVLLAAYRHGRSCHFMTQ
jgi:SRSO17 transposase